MTERLQLSALLRRKLTGKEYKTKGSLTKSEEVAMRRKKGLLPGRLRSQTRPGLDEVVELWM